MQEEDEAPQDFKIREKKTDHKMLPKGEELVKEFSERRAYREELPEFTFKVNAPEPLKQWKDTDTKVDVTRDPYSFIKNFNKRRAARQAYRESNATEIEAKAYEKAKKAKKEVPEWQKILQESIENR